MCSEDYIKTRNLHDETCSQCRPNRYVRAWSIISEETSWKNESAVLDFELEKHLEGVCLEFQRQIW
jgi:hypothetical protein